MDHSKYVRLLSDELTDDILRDAAVYGSDNSKIGSVSNLHGSGPGAEAIIDVGGFLGIGTKSVVVPVSQLDLMRDECHVVHALTTWTKDQLKDLPEYG